jgi:hypothetical protein
MPVHDVDMQIVGTRRRDRARLLAESGEVGGENRRGYSCRLAHKVS